MGTVHTLQKPVEILTLGLAGEAFALEAGIVSEILDLVPITLVPNGPEHAPGLINVRGKVVPLIDLRVLLGMEQAANSINTRIIVIETLLDNEPTTIGLLADKVYEVTGIDLQAIENTPKVGMTWPAEYIRGIGRHNGGDFLIVLDINAIFSSAK